MDRTVQARESSCWPHAAEKERIAIEVRRLLMATGRFSSDQVEVSAWDDTVRLRGHVRTYYQKQLAQATALNVAGVHHLENEVEVA